MGPAPQGVSRRSWPPRLVPASPDGDLCMTSSNTREAGGAALRAGGGRIPPGCSPPAFAYLPITTGPRGRLPPEPRAPLPSPPVDTTCSRVGTSPGLRARAPRARRGPLPQPLLAHLQTRGDPPPAETSSPSRGDAAGSKSAPAAPCPQGWPAGRHPPASTSEKPTLPSSPPDASAAIGHCLRFFASLIPLTSNRTEVSCVLPGASGPLGMACPL